MNRGWLKPAVHTFAWSADVLVEDRNPLIGQRPEHRWERQTFQFDSLAEAARDHANSYGSPLIRNRSEVHGARS